MMKEMRTELRNLILTDIQKIRDPLAAQWSGSVVTITGWYLSWIVIGVNPENGEWLYHPVWKVRIKEVPDRWFVESQLLRIMYHD